MWLLSNGDAIDDGPARQQGEEIVFQVRRGWSISNVPLQLAVPTNCQRHACQEGVASSRRELAAAGPAP